MIFYTFVELLICNIFFFYWKQGNSASCESKSGLDSCDECYDKQLYGWYGAIRRKLQRSQYQIQYRHPVRIAVWIFFLLCFIGELLVWLYVCYIIIICRCMQWNFLLKTYHFGNWGILPYYSFYSYSYYLLNHCMAFLLKICSSLSSF